MAENRINKTVQQGIVTSNKMDKSIVVTVERRMKHPVYGKYIMRKRKFMAHDEQNTCQIGDTVQIIEHKPISKKKRWRLQTVISRTAGE